MPPPPTDDAQAGRVPWIALVALVALLVGLGLAWQQTRPARRAEPAMPGGEPPEQAIDQPLQQTTPAAPPIDSTAFKQRWIDDVRGADVSGLDPKRLMIFLRFANAEQCTCGCNYTLAGCRASDMTCDVSGPRIGALLDSIRAGQITSARGLRTRPRG